MSTPRLPNQKTQYKKLNERLSKYMASVLSIYESLNKEAAKIALSTDYDGTEEFSFDDYPITKDRVQKLQQQFVSDLGGVIMSGTSEEWKNSNLLQDMIADKVLGKYVGEHKGKEFEHYYQKNSGALKAFQQRKDKGLNLSQKLWNQSADYKTELEEILSVSIEKGIDAVTLSKRVSKYLWDFPSMQAAYEEKFGHASRAKNCEYRSIRLARSEINMAYRTAEQERWRQFDFVVGYEIKLSGSHPVTDVCDDLKGKYPKDFVWTGWHPNCYTDQAQVLTDKGWKFFVDVKQDDMILSLNPNTRDVEWTRISAMQCYPYKGEIVRFYNKSLECSVTPDHQMVYLNKGDGSIKKTTALNYRKGLGSFYRTCVHKDQDERKFIDINGDIWNFDDYCEFMGYWLADGSIQHTTGVVLSQKVGEHARQPMIECLKRLGYKFTENEFVINIYRSAVARYLSQFGVCNEKFVPQEILQASKRQINIFLDAFIKCDGYMRKSKSFVGNRNTIFNSDKDERMYFTTSQRLAGDICHLLLLIGHRPSFVLKETTITTKEDGSTIKGNYKCYNIRECYSGSSTVFDKEMLNYDGNVYDVTLEKNHIMYISYNGKCFWGSNCMCYAVPILKTEDEYFADEDVKSPNEVTDVPTNFKEWRTENFGRISDAKRKKKSMPYFVRDNYDTYVERYELITPEEVKKFKKKDYHGGDGSVYQVDFDRIYKEKGFTEDEVKEMKSMFDRHRYGDYDQHDNDMLIREAMYDEESRLGELLRLHASIEEECYMAYRSTHGDIRIVRAGSIEKDTLSYSMNTHGAYKYVEGEEVLFGYNHVTSMDAMIKENRLLAGFADRTIGYYEDNEVFFVRRERKYSSKQELHEYNKKQKQRSDKEAAKLKGKKLDEYQQMVNDLMGMVFSNIKLARENGYDEVLIENSEAGYNSLKKFYNKMKKALKK